MNAVILNLEKRKQRILRMRNTFKAECDKENNLFIIKLNQFDTLLYKIVTAIKGEWNKQYIK